MGPYRHTSPAPTAPAIPTIPEAFSHSSDYQSVMTMASEVVSIDALSEHISSHTIQPFNEADFSTPIHRATTPTPEEASVFRV
jgi:hypothetical protein